MMSPPAADRLLPLADRLKALGDVTRLRILHALEGEELFVDEVRRRVGCSQATASKQLSVLRRAGLVASRREGMHVFYRVDDDAVFTICRLLCQVMERQAGETAEAASAVAEGSRHQEARP